MIYQKQLKFLITNKFIANIHYFFGKDRYFKFIINHRYEIKFVI